MCLSLAAFRFIYILALAKFLSICLRSIDFLLCLYHLPHFYNNVFIQSSVNGRLDCFHFLPIFSPLRQHFTTSTLPPSCLSLPGAEITVCVTMPGISWPPSTVLL